MYNGWLWNLFFSQFTSSQQLLFWCWCFCSMAKVQTWAQRSAAARQVAYLAQLARPTFSAVPLASPLPYFLPPALR